MHPYEALNLVLQLFDAAKDPAVECSAFQLSEPAFNCIEPRGTRGSEVKLYPRMREAAIESALSFIALFSIMRARSTRL